MQWTQPLTDSQVLGVMSDEGRGLLRGCYFGEFTQHGVLDVDRESKYHSAQELEKLTGYFAPYPEKQINKVVELCKALVNKYPNIGKEDILTHYEIATPEGRKNDPFGLDIQNIVNKIFNE